MRYQKDYPNLAPSLEPIKSLKVGDLITNIYSFAVWPASEFDVSSIKPDVYEEHLKFRKMISKI